MHSRTIDATQLRRLLVFVAIVEEQSMTSAARCLGVSKSVVSEHLRRLEDGLGVRLLERTTRRLFLTQAGRGVYTAAARMQEAGLEAIDVATRASGQVRGILRVACPEALVTTLLGPVLAALVTEHPLLRVQLFASDQLDDLYEQALDVAIRVGTPEDSSMVMRTLAQDEEMIVASPVLAARYADAVTPRDLVEAPWLRHRALGVRRDRFSSQGQEPMELKLPPAVVEVGNASALMDLCARGVGFFVAPRVLASPFLESGRLQQVLPRWRRRSVKLYAIMPSRATAPRVRVFLDAVQAAAAKV